MKVKIVPINGLDCGGGYCGEDGVIYIDEFKSPKEKRLIAIHEVLHHRLDPWIGHQIPHGYIDTIAEDIISVEDQL